MKKILKSGFTLVFLCIAGAAWAKNPYPSVGACDGLPKVNVKTIAGTCVGVVASDLKMPRGVLPLSDDEIFVTEMGSWEQNTGRLSRLVRDNNHYVRTTLMDKLDRPHGIAIDSNGWVNVAEAGEVFAFDPKKPSISKHAGHLDGFKQVLTSLPNIGLHPIKQIIFDGNGDMFISMGATTDHCERSQASSSVVSFPCKETLGAQATASIWKITSPSDAARKSVWANGLRNAMGMVISEKGELIATENGRDNIKQGDKKLNDEQLPHDELNVVQQGVHYGWPYCFDNNRLSPEYRRNKNACKDKAKPTTLLPAHSAPLGIILYPKNGEITALRGYYLIALHGYRHTGHEVVKIKAGADGRPTGAISSVISGWERTDNQPMGAPVELRVSPSGKVYITDDRNDVLFRLSNSQ